MAKATPEAPALRPLPRYPALYQINTRVWLTALARSLGRPATLDDIPDAELDRLVEMGFDWIWLLSVWQTGPAGQQVSRGTAAWRVGFQQILPDLCDDDIAGSGFAITGYTVHVQMGGDEALARLRARLRTRGLHLMLDFVPNHTGLDHPWVEDHPEYYVQGTERDLAQAPANYTWVQRKQGDQLLAYGRDPYFPGWPDALQLNYGNPATQEAMIGELLKVAGQCDGVRCDMAMLVLPEVFERTWGIAARPFWPDAIRRVRERAPGFCFMAEVYWDLEWALQQQGFDYTYDKRLYDRLRAGQARPVREHLLAGLDYQDKLARFLENHDEPRAAAVFPPDVHRAAAAITFLTPGLRFFQRGQFEGARTHVSPHLCRAPEEPTDPAIAAFYDRVCAVLREPAVRDGQWRLLECAAAWDGNGTSDCFVAFAWEASAVNDGMAPADQPAARPPLTPPLQGGEFSCTSPRLGTPNAGDPAFTPPLEKGGLGGVSSCAVRQPNAIRSDDAERLVVAVNYAPHASQCYVRLPYDNLAGARWRLSDQLGDAVYDRDGDDLASRGLYLDVPPWHIHAFSLTRAGERS